MVRSSSLLSGSFLTNRKGWSGFQKAANTLCFAVDIEAAACLFAFQNDLQQQLTPGKPFNQLEMAGRSLYTRPHMDSRWKFQGFTRSFHPQTQDGVSAHLLEACELTEMASSDPGRQPLLQVLEALTTFLIFKGRVIAAANLQEAPALACFNQLTVVFNHLQWAAGGRESSSTIGNDQQKAANQSDPWLFLLLLRNTFIDILLRTRNHSCTLSLAKFALIWRKLMSHNIFFSENHSISPLLSDRPSASTPTSISLSNIHILIQDPNLYPASKPKSISLSNIQNTCPSTTILLPLVYQYTYTYMSFCLENFLPRFGLRLCLCLGNFLRPNNVESLASLTLSALAGIATLVVPSAPGGKSPMEREIGAGTGTGSPPQARPRLGPGESQREDKIITSPSPYLERRGCSAGRRYQISGPHCPVSMVKTSLSCSISQDLTVLPLWSDLTVLSLWSRPHCLAPYPRTSLICLYGQDLNFDLNPDKVIMEQPTPAKGFRYPRRAPLTAAQLVLFSWQKNCIPDGELISFAWFLGPEERELTLYDRKLADLGAEQVSRLPILLPVWLGNPKPGNRPLGPSNPKPVKPQPSSGVSDMETTYRQQRLIRMISKRLLIAYPKKWMTSTFACESHLPRKKGEGGKMHILVAMQKLMPEREFRRLIILIRDLEAGIELSNLYFQLHRRDICAYRDQRSGSAKKNASRPGRKRNFLTFPQDQEGVASAFLQGEINLLATAGARTGTGTCLFR
ncbi:hypothetical protein MBM_08344 [Drepanopeziza brunnea f. sp. 'multigermtubi' MB_m1]|uniref:Uncharacterized protein n=1 Tax=Marssonina brunnea f. sp. multigermtubi (strain MB_m1) TaxID=1072389 RepID=K1WLB7_MARBU|nr:uncharacterized protein MBM_08344 [Drepanopeziza brunnea f. sp. 'multigermtubi' MB_m1]EKD13626.1 hypothetical protein MBM_08344 [Drepanopeziza brunnea f. sp. 'multigermtubi' MB_m1]